MVIYDRKMFKEMDIYDDIKMMMVDIECEYPKMKKNYNIMNHLKRLILLDVDDIYIIALRYI